MADDELSIVVTDMSGATTTLDSNAASPGDRPRGIQFSTQLGSGFTTGGYNLSRAIDRDNVDQNLLDSVRFVSSSGDIAYEGFIGAMPRSMDDTHTLTVSTAGWMASAADESFTEVFVDRDMSAWGPPSRTERVADIAAGFTDHDPQVVTDANGYPSVRLEFRGPWAAGSLPISHAFYDAGPGNFIGQVIYQWTRGANVNAPADANWLWQIFTLTTDNLAGGFDTPTAINAAGPGFGTFTATPGVRRFAALRFYYTVAAPGTLLAYNIDFYRVAVIGDHGLSLIATTDPLGIVGTATYGVTASDVIRWVCGTYCPMLNTAGVQSTTHSIEHLVFKERTKPYDAFLKVNSWHLWDLAVWENRTLYFAPIDLTDWDWEVRHDEIGTTIGLQGDSYESLRNGIIVQYTNVDTGNPGVLLPANYAELRDESVDNPANVHGRNMYGEPFVIPFPCTTANALELGRVRLREDNQPKAPGSFTVHDQIRDREGNWQPVWKVRSGQRVRLTSSVNLSDRPRLIAETSYSHDGRSLTIGVDSTLRNLEGFLDRTQTALTAAGLAT